MNRAGPLLLILATLVFIASTLFHAVQPAAPGQPRAAGAGDFGTAPGPLGPEGQFDLVGLFMRPRVPAMAALLAVTWIALAAHALGRLAAVRRVRAIARVREQRRATARAGPDPVSRAPLGPAPPSSLPDPVPAPSALPAAGASPPPPGPEGAGLRGAGQDRPGLAGGVARAGIAGAEAGPAGAERGTRRMLHSMIGPPTPDQFLREHLRGGDLRTHAPAILGLLAGAAWPWLVSPSPLAALVLAAAMLAGLVGAALRGTGSGRHRRRGGAMGFAAGWATLAVFALVATLMQRMLGASLTLAAVIALTMAALAAVSVQLRLGSAIGYGVAVIWGMIAIAAGSVGVDSAIATMAVLGIAAVAVALVRVTT